jgi:hypothetical protein
MKPSIGGIRLKLGAAVDSQPAAPLPDGERGGGQLGAILLATKIAVYTVKVLLEGEMLDPASATEQLRIYGSSLVKKPDVDQSFLRFLFPDEGRLAMVIGWLNSRANLHVWEMANRIPPPQSFYKAHPSILEACRLCGAVVLDASTPSTITTGSINPLTGDFLASWIQTELESDPSETRPRFFFNVAIPPRLWPGITHSHFRYDHGV